MVNLYEQCLNNATCHPAAYLPPGKNQKKGERLNTLQTHVTEFINFELMKKKYNQNVSVVDK